MKVKLQVASSYARKYALSGLFAIDGSEDADALNNVPDYNEPAPAAPQRNPNHTYNANGIRTLNQSEFNAAIDSFRAGKVTIEKLLDENSFALNAEQHGFIVGLSDEV